MEKRTAARLALVAAAGLTASCAHTPDTTVSYYLPKSQLSVKVIRTVSCNNFYEPSIRATVIPTVSFVADTSKQHSLALKSLDSKFANTTAGVNFHPSGTLSGINASGKGVGKDIIVAALKVAATASGTGVWFRGRTKPQFKDQCEYIKNSTKDGVISLVYEGDVELKQAEYANTAEGQNATVVSETMARRLLSSPGSGSPVRAAAMTDLLTKVVSDKPRLQPIPPSLESIVGHDKLAAMLGNVCAFVIPKSTMASPPVAKPPAEGGWVGLTLREPALSTIVVSGGSPCSKTNYWQGEIVDAANGMPYDVAIPKAAAFGRSSFTLAVAESGRITSIAYEKDTGIGDATSAFGEALDAFTKTSAEKAAELNAEADLIMAQERIAKCEAKPSECTK